MQSSGWLRDETAEQGKAIELGHPSYVWQFGQDRRLKMIMRWVNLQDAKILDIGCGIGTYVRHFRQFSEDVYGVDVEPERVAEASKELPNICVARSEQLPFPDNTFDMTLLNEVIEHVDDDHKTIAEACRVTKPGGYIVIFAPNRLYPFETHGAYFGGRYKFGNIPLIGWLPDPLRNIFAPHVRAYMAGDIRNLFKGLPVRIRYHRVIYPGFDKLSSRHKMLGAVLRRALYFAENTPLHILGLSHFVVAQKTARANEPKAEALQLVSDDS